MFCQLDQVKQILDIATTVRNIVVKDAGVNSLDQALDIKACNLIFGLLLINEYDVFIQEGVILLGDREYPHYWTEVYLDGEAFILDTTIARLAPVLNKDIPEVYFMPQDEAVEEYGYGKGKEFSWQREACDKSIWQRVLAELDIKGSVEDIIQEISDLA